MFARWALTIERSTSSSARWVVLEALVEILRSRLELVGPVTEARLRGVINLPASQIRAGLLTLEAQGSVMRGRVRRWHEEEWCERRVLIRIHRYPATVSGTKSRPCRRAVDLLFRWQRVAMEGRDDRA